MQKFTNAIELKIAIEQLENRQSVEAVMLKAQFLITYENLKPINLLKKAFKEVTTAPDFKEDILGATIGLTAGHLSKAIIIGVSHNPLKKLFGALLEKGITNIISNNSDALKLMAEKAIRFFNKKKKPENSNEKNCGVEGKV